MAVRVGVLGHRSQMQVLMSSLDLDCSLSRTSQEEEFPTKYLLIEKNTFQNVHLSFLFISRFYY